MYRGLKTSLATFFLVLSLVGSTAAYEYSASPIGTVALSLTAIFALVFVGLTGLCILALVIGRGHRTPYAPLLIASALTFFAALALIGQDLIDANVDRFEAFPSDLYTAASGIRCLFTNWSLAFVFLAFAHLIKVRTDKVVEASSGTQTTGLSPAWTHAYSASFVLQWIFGTTAFGLYIRFFRSLFRPEEPSGREIMRRHDEYRYVQYTFGALWYASALLLGVLAVLALTITRRASRTTDRVLTILLFLAFPSHILNIIQDIVFTIIDSPSIGISVWIDDSFLPRVILSFGFRAVTIAALIFVGLQRRSWSLVGQPNTQQMQPYQYGAYQYGGNPVYPAQANYPAHPIYPAQAIHQTSA